MMLRSSITAGVVLALTLCAQATAHVKIGDNWLFAGSTYNTDQPRGNPPDHDNRSDPITVIWRGPSGATATVGRVMDHTEQHWTDRRIPGRYPRGHRMRPRDLPLCTSAQLTWFRDGTEANSGGWTQSSGYMSTNGACTNQYHVRLWSSARHGIYFPAEEHQSEWVFTPIHHEHIVFDPLDDQRPPHHEIDRRWDATRSVYMHALRKVHCRDRGWAVHPESSTDYGPFPNSGTISRMSFRHGSTASECEGA
jgi:hypothetical protein